VEFFTAHRGKQPSPMWHFFNALVPNEPQMLPEPWASKPLKSIMGVRANAEARLGCKIRYRTWSGKVWAMRLPEEER